LKRIVILQIIKFKFRPGHGLQNAAYCGHHHSHCLGYQFVELPTGVNLVFGPFNGFEHDSSRLFLLV
jgi:hypothetical protein